MAGEAEYFECGDVHKKDGEETGTASSRWRGARDGISGSKERAGNLLAHQVVMGEAAGQTLDMFLAAVGPSLRPVVSPQKTFGQNIKDRAEHTPESRGVRRSLVRWVFGSVLAGHVFSISGSGVPVPASRGRRDVGDRRCGRVS